MATRPAGRPRKYFTLPNQLTMRMAKQTSPMAGVRNICSAGRMEMNVIETPASVPSRAARGVTLRTHRPMKPPITSTKLWMNTQVRPASQALMGSPVLSLIGSMMTKTTINM